MLASFRLLQISDIHLSTIPNLLNQRDHGPFHTSPELRGRYNVSQWRFSTYDREYLEVMAKAVVDTRKKYDVLLISGDLCTFGDQKYLDQGKKFLSTPPLKNHIARDSYPTLQLVGAPRTFVIPGNHDRYAGHFNAPGNQLFDGEFRDYWHNAANHVGHYVSTERRGFRLIVAAVDFSLKRAADSTSPTSMWFWGQGKAYSERIKELQERTKALRNEYSQSLVIWVSHFSLSDATPEELKLIDAEDLIEAAKESKVHIILTGHIHLKNAWPQNASPRDGDTVVLGAGSGSSTAVLDGHWIHLIDVTMRPDGIATLSRRNFRIDPKSLKYTHDGTDVYQDLRAFATARA